MLLDWVSLKHAFGRSIGLENMDAQLTLEFKGKISEEQTVLLTNLYSLQEKLPKSKILFEIIREIKPITKKQSKGGILLYHTQGEPKCFQDRKLWL